MLNFYKKIVIFFFMICVYSVYAFNSQTIHILSLLENKKYNLAAGLIEEQIIKSKNNKQKGYYALLMNQLPSNIVLKKKQHEYAFLAASLVKNIPQKKKLFLWIEAGDGFFKSGNLKKAEFCYTKSLSYMTSKSPEYIYVLYKKAWIYINKKQWHKAFTLLTKARTQTKNHLKDSILHDIGKTWAENQFFKNPISLNLLNKIIKDTTLKQQKLIIKGMVNGIQRSEIKNINTIASVLLKDQKLSATVLNYILSHKQFTTGESCELVDWITKTDIQYLNKNKILILLNSCTRFLMAQKYNKQVKKRKLKQIVNLYIKFKTIGLERWPLVLIYEYLNKNQKACNESLHQLKEVVNKFDKKDNAKKDDSKKDNSNKKIEQLLLISVRLCKKTQAKVNVVKEVIKSLFSSDVILNKYKTIKNPFENILFNLLKLNSFTVVLQQNILTINKSWQNKDLLQALVLSNIKNYSSTTIKSFFNRFALNPIDEYYLDIIINQHKIFTVQELQKWIPISSINSYRKSIPWLKKSLLHQLNNTQEKQIVEKLLEYFPVKNKQEVSLFVAIYYLKKDKLLNIFNNWNIISSAFDKKALAVELFEKVLYNDNQLCKQLQSVFALKKVKIPKLLQYTIKCCKIKNSKTIKIHTLKIPNVLKSSALAWDFILLVNIHKKTNRLKKNINKLHNQVSVMIMRLKKDLLKYKNRKWRLKTIGQKVNVLLNKQIDIYITELTKLSKISEFQIKYKQLKNIIIQWR